MRSAATAKRFGILAAVVLLLGIPRFTEDPYFLHTCIMAMYYMVLALSLRLVMTTGEVSFAHAAFVAIGAYVSALLVIHLGLSTWVAMPLAGLAAGLVALVIGYPSLRLKGAYFFLVTFAFGQIVVLILGSYWEDILGGYTGLVGIPAPHAIGPWTFVTKAPNFYFMAVLTLLTTLFVHRIDSSRIGLTLRAIAANDALAQNVGVNLMRCKVTAFSLACFIAGVAGGFLAHYVHIISPGSFSFLQSVQILAYCVVGGTATLFGPLAGVVVLTALTECVRTYGPYEHIVYGIALMLVLLLMPEGLVAVPRYAAALGAKLRGGVPDS